MTADSDDLTPPALRSPGRIKRRSISMTNEALVEYVRSFGGGWGFFWHAAFQATEDMAARGRSPFSGTRQVLVGMAEAVTREQVFLLSPEATCLQSTC